MCGGVQGHVKAVLLIFQLMTADPEAPVHTDKVTVQFCRENLAMTMDLSEVSAKDSSEEGRVRRAIISVGATIFPIS